MQALGQAAHSLLERGEAVEDEREAGQRSAGSGEAAAS